MERYLCLCQLLIDISIDKKIDLVKNFELLEELRVSGFLKLSNKQVAEYKLTETGIKTANVFNILFKFVDDLKEIENKC